MSRRHRLASSIPHVERDAAVLLDGTLKRLERHAIAIAEHADELRSAGRDLKRGVLIQGPPGTDKTLTVNYPLSASCSTTWRGSPRTRTSTPSANSWSVATESQAR